MPQELTDREVEGLLLSSDPAALARLDELRKSPQAWQQILKVCSAIAHGTRLGRNPGRIEPDEAAALDRACRRGWAVFRERFRPPGTAPGWADLPRLAAQTDAARETAALVGVGVERGVHALFVDPTHSRAYVRPLFARFIESETFDVIPRIYCDPVMRAAATRAAAAALDELQTQGFSTSLTKGRAIEWWIDGPTAYYEGASIGLAMALVTAAITTGTALDRQTVVSGAVEGDRVLKVGGIAEKYRAVASLDFARLLMPADSRGDLPDAARTARAPRVVFVSSLHDAISATMGLALGLAEDRLSASPASGSSVTLDMWVELADASMPGATRGISVERAGSVKHWRIGDALRVGLRASDDCHIALLNVGPSGNTSCLLPNPYHPDARSQAGEAFYFPGPQDEFRFTLNGPVGRERLIALGTRDPIHASLPVLARLAAGTSADPVDLLELLSSSAILARASADLIVEDASVATRSVGGGGLAENWRSYDL